MKPTYLLLSLSIIMASCSSEESSDEKKGDAGDKVDTTAQVDQAAPQIVKDSVLGEFNMDEYTDEESEMAELNREKPQDPFCACVCKSDSLSAIIDDMDNQPEDVWDAAFAERNRMINNECANLLNQGTTDEEQRAHDRKVNKCKKGCK